MEPSAPISQLEQRSRIRNAISKFGDWALGKALDFLLVGVLAVITAPGIAIWIYFRSGRAAWTYPWLYAALGFIAACVVIVLMASVLSIIRARRKRAAELAINLEFLSPDKGYLDHAVNQGKGFKTFNSLLNGLGKAVGDIAKTQNRATKQITLAQRVFGAQPNILAFIGRNIANRTAKHVNKNAAKIQSYLSRLEKTSDLLIESVTGYTSWFTVASADQAATLIANRAGINQMVTTIRSTAESMESYRDAQRRAYGISQELNTAINRLSHATDGVITFLRQTDAKWTRVIRLMDDKIRAWEATLNGENNGM